MSPSKKVPIILSVVSNEYQVLITDLVAKVPQGRPVHHLEAKYVGIYLMRKATYFSMSHIGEIFGYSRTSGQKGPEWVEAKMFTDDDFKRRVSKLEAILPQIFNIHK